MMIYSFGILGSVIWSIHILVGLMLAYLGYRIVYGMSINKNWGLVLLTLGVLAGLYHTHLWINDFSEYN